MSCRLHSSLVVLVPQSSAPSALLCFIIEECRPRELLVVSQSSRTRRVHAPCRRLPLARGRRGNSSTRDWTGSRRHETFTSLHFTSTSSRVPATHHPPSSTRPLTMAAQQKVEEVVFNQPKVGGMLCPYWYRPVVTQTQ